MRRQNDCVTKETIINKGNESYFNSFNLQLKYNIQNTLFHEGAMALQKLEYIDKIICY